MIFDYIIYVLVSTLVGLASYYLTSNVYFLVVTLGVYLIYFIIYELLFKRKTRSRLEKNKDLTTFIHDFFLAYNVDFSIANAINKSKNNASRQLKERLKMVSEFKAMEQLERLTDYFSSSLYQLFLKTLYLSENNREDHAKTISFLLEENNRFMLNQKALKRNIVRALIEFSLLWIVSFLILIIMRFAINNYFNKIITLGIYLGGVAAYFIFFLFSIHLFMHATNGSIKRYEQ